MKLLFVILSLVSLSTFANEIIKISDGSVAKCDTKVDVLKYRAQSIYRPLSFEFRNGAADVTVEFLKCVQEGEAFKFVRDTNISERTVTFEAGPMSRDGQTVRIEREKFTLVAFRSDTVRIHSKNELTSNGDNTYSASLPLKVANLQESRDGEKFFEMTVSNKMVMIDEATNRVIDSRIDFLGSYRMTVK